jgi:pilus assembly protein TadC
MVMESEIKMIDVYEVEVMLTDMNKLMDELNYRLSTLEDSVAELSAYKTEGETNA